MDLEKCKACGHDVALSARKCPHCGANLRQQRAQDPAIRPLVTKWAITQCTAVILLLVIFFGINMWYSAENSMPLAKAFLPPLVKAEIVARRLRIAKILIFGPSVSVFPLAIYESKLKKQLKDAGYF